MYSVNRIAIGVFILTCVCAQSASAKLVGRSTEPEADNRLEQMAQTVIAINDLRIREGPELYGGTGFCLDPDCRFIGTNYHVAVNAHPHRIKGEKVVERYLGTGPNETNATPNALVSGGLLRYVLDKDLAIYELRHPLRDHHGLTFSTEELKVGQRVDIYSYPREGLNPFRKLLRFAGTFAGRTSTGLVAFDYELTDGNAIRPGASGGIVVDRETQQIVGVLSAVALNEKQVALAVPVDSLAEFVRKVHPFLGEAIFPTAKDVPPYAPDFYPKFVPIHTGKVDHRLEETRDVKLLREKAQLMADSMRSFIAVQTFAWGKGNHPPSARAAYEIRYVDGDLRFRDFPNGKKLYRDVPFPNLNTSIVPAGEWSVLPELVGKQLGVNIHQAPDIVSNGRKFKVFQYWAAVEDYSCSWRTVDDFVLFSFDKTKVVSCYGEVWTDQDTNILRISEHFELHGRFETFDGVVTYGWYHRTDDSPRLIPVTFSVGSRQKGKIYWCRGEFTNYRMFDTRSRLVVSQSAPASLNGFGLPYRH